MPETVETFDVLIAQISQKFNLSHADAAADLQAALKRQPHFANLTELGEEDDLATAKAVAEAAGYRFYGDKKWDCAVLARQDVVHLDAGYRFVHGGAPGSKSGRIGGYYPRGITWVRGLVDGREDLDIWFGGGHPITKQTGQLRLEHRAAMANAFAEELESNSVRSRIAVAAMDANEGDAPGADRPTAKVLEDAGCATIWDDLNTYPSTLDGHRGTIDWLIRRRRDKRATWQAVKAYDQVHADHAMVLGTLRVELKPPPHHACPACGFDHEIQAPA